MNIRYGPVTVINQLIYPPVFSIFISIFNSPQALKRYASVQVDNLNISPNSRELTLGSDDQPDALPSSIPEDSTCSPRRTSELFSLLKASRGGPSAANALLALPPVSRLGSIMAAQEKKSLLVHPCQSFE